jgi:hypothetical protein
MSRGLLFALALAACGPPIAPDPGVLTVTFTPTKPQNPDVQLTTAKMRLDRVMVFGNQPPPMPPPGPPMPMGFDFDALSTGMSLVYTKLPQGLYSRVQFDLLNVVMDGTWKGTPFHARLATFRPVPADARSPVAKELGPGRDVSFTVTVDEDSWFANGVLEMAMQSGGMILYDEVSNPTLSMQLLDQVRRSFKLE